MDRESFIDLLSRLVSDGVITEDYAIELLALYDAGLLPDGWQLPLPPDQAIVGYDRLDDELALLALLALINRSRESSEIVLSVSTVSTRIGWANGAQDAFEQRVRRLAAQFVNGDMTLSEWHAAMLSEMRQNAINQVRIGLGRRDLLRNQIARLDEIVREQAAFLQRFADEIAGRLGLGDAYTEARIAARSEQYGGFARAEMFRQMEETGNYRRGWVVRYVAQDDANTCMPCYDAGGYYLPGAGPMPGEICLGRSRCRCRRIPEYNPAMYAELGGV